MTSRDLLREQLDVLQAGAADLFHTVCEQDARQLQANGVFLRDRFSPTTSSLNLPRPGGGDPPGRDHQTPRSDGGAADRVFAVGLGLFTRTGPNARSSSGPARR